MNQEDAPKLGQVRVSPNLCPTQCGHVCQFEIMGENPY